jgi:hypothetical protein
MRFLESRASINNQTSIGLDVLRSGLWLLWQGIRAAVLGVLMLLEPVVRSLFGLAMILGVLVSVIFEFSAVGPRFPFLAMLAASLACGLVLFLYSGLVAWLVRQG